jgi:hypothetical protein
MTAESAGIVAAPLFAFASLAGLTLALVLHRISTELAGIELL